MGVSNLGLVVFGLWLSSAAGKISNDIWNVRSYDNYDVVELEKQFEADWNNVQDPLDWMDNDMVENHLSEFTQEESDEIPDENIDSTETENRNSVYQEGNIEDTVSTSEEFERRLRVTLSDSDSHETDSFSGNRYRKRKNRKETADRNSLHGGENTDSVSTSVESGRRLRVSSSDSVSTSEEYKSSSDSVDEFEDSSEKTSSDSDSDGSRSQRFRGNRYKKRKGRNNSRNIKKTWMKRRGNTERNKRRFRNPHGAKEQVQHPPKIGRWFRVWQRFNSSIPAKAGRWAAMYNRTQKYWIRNKNGDRIRNTSTGSVDTSLTRERFAENKRNHTHHSPHWPSRNHTHHHRTHPWHSGNQTFHNRSHGLRQVHSGFTSPNGTHPWHSGNQTFQNRSHGLRRVHSGFTSPNGTHPWHSGNQTFRSLRIWTLDSGFTSPNGTKVNHTFPGRWLANKVADVCNIWKSPRHGRYMQHKKYSTQRDYRLDLADQMMICCQKEFEQKLDCFGNLTRARIDEYCRSGPGAPFIPWKPSQNPRAMNKIKPKCCLPEGEARYNCFNRTHQILKRYNMSQPITELREEEEVVLEEPPVLRTPVRRGRIQNRRQMRRKARKEHRSTPKQNVKTTCCTLGKEYGAQLDEEGGELKACNKLARKLSHKYKPKVICHMAMGRCCINEARKQRERSVQLDSEMQQEI